MTHRFAYHQNTLCLSVEAVSESMGIQIEAATNTVWKGLERYRSTGSGAWAHYPDANDARRRWIVYNSLPETTRMRVDYYYGNVVAAYWQERLTDAALERILPADREHFLHLKPRKGGAGFTALQVGQLAEGCGWLRLAGSDWWTGRYDRRSQFWESASQALFKRDLYGLHISNARTLERKLKAWDEQGYEALMPKKFGNSNAMKITAEQRKRIIHIYCSPLKPSAVKTAEIYNREAAERGWSELSEERIRQLLRESETSQICNLARHGKDAARGLQERTILRRRPSHADALWIVDGSTIQLYYQDEKGQVRSDLYAVAIADGYSGAIIGKGIGFTETSTLVQAALRNAVRNTGMMPYQVQYDNSSANKSLEARQVFDKLAQLHFPTAPYSGKAKVIEAIWGRMEQSYLHSFPSFKGGNITARSLDARANPDHLAALKKSGNLPGRDAVIAQFTLAIEALNNTPGKRDGLTPAERYRTPHADRREMDELVMIEAFWVDRRHPVRYSKDGIIMEVDGQRYTYEVESERGVEDMKFRLSYLGEQFTVKYDPDDLTLIALYRDGAYVASAVQKYAAPMAVADMEEGEGQIIHKALDQRRNYWQMLEEKAQEIGADMSAVGFEAVDFRTIHKDALNRLEGAMLDQLLEAAAIPGTAAPARTKRVKLYDDSDADGSIIISQ